jgi:hypothetical protein
MLLLKRKGDQISLLMLIIFLCLQTHHRPARKREGWEHLTPFLIQLYGLEVTKKSEPEKPILCQIVQEKFGDNLVAWFGGKIQIFQFPISFATWILFLHSNNTNSDMAQFYKSPFCIKKNLTLKKKLTEIMREYFTFWQHLSTSMRCIQKTKFHLCKSPNQAKQAKIENLHPLTKRKLQFTTCHYPNSSSPCFFPNGE